MHPDSPPLNSIMPNVTSVSPRVMLTDGDTPLRLTLCGAHLGRAVDGDGASAAVSRGPECVREAVWGRAAAAAAAAGGAAAAIGVVNCDCDLEADLRDPRPQSVSVIARCRCDDHLTLRTSAVPGASPDSTVEIEFQPPRVPAGAAEVVWIEVWSGTYLSPAVPVLVTPDVDLACSVEALLAKSQRLCTGGNRVRRPCRLSRRPHPHRACCNSPSSYACSPSCNPRRLGLYPCRSPDVFPGLDGVTLTHVLHACGTR